MEDRHEPAVGRDRDHPDWPLTLVRIAFAEVEGDLIKKDTFYWDNASFLMQLGLMPEPAGAAPG